MYIVVQLPAMVAHLDVHPTGDLEVLHSTPPVWKHSFLEIYLEIFSTFMLSLPLIQEG